MRITSISSAACSVILIQVLILQAFAQSQPTELAPNTTIAALPQNTTEVSVPLAALNQSQKSSSSPVPNEVNSTTPNAELTTPAVTESKSSPAGKIIMDGFVETNLNEGSTESDMITMTDPTIDTTARFNATTEVEMNSSIATESAKQTSDELTLSFISSSSHIHAAASILPEAQSAIIITSTFLILAVTAYGGLVIWRRILERKYGNRELLVNEEFYDVNGLKYFEL